MSAAALQKLVRDVPDHPKPGILFKDITPVLADARAFADAIEQLVAPYANLSIDAVLGIEARGFMFAAPVAIRLGAGFVPVRKPGKLPRAVERVEYALEYGSDCVEMHRDALAPGARVLLIDDVIATGGTAKATLDLARRLGAEVIGASFLIELSFLDGARKLDVPCASVLRY